MKYKKIVVFAITGVVLTGAIGFWIYQDRQPGKYDAFAACLEDKGAIFYGTFWCAHCQNQKAMFGKSAERLPYVECSTPDGKGQLSVCQEKKIEGYPTWEFLDGSRMSGEVSLSTLSEKTGCGL